MGSIQSALYTSDRVVAALIAGLELECGRGAAEGRLNNLCHELLLRSGCVGEEIRRAGRRRQRQRSPRAFT